MKNQSYPYSCHLSEIFFLKTLGLELFNSMIIDSEHFLSVYNLLNKYVYFTHHKFQLFLPVYE